MEKLFVSIRKIRFKSDRYKKQDQTENLNKQKNWKEDVLYRIDIIKTLSSIFILSIINVSQAHICDDSMSEEECDKTVLIHSMEAFKNKVEEKINEMKRKITETETQLVKLKTELQAMKSNPKDKSHCADINYFIDMEIDQLCTNNGYIQDLSSLYISDQEECNKVYMESFINETEKKITEMKKKISETETQLVKLKTELQAMKSNPDFKPLCLLLGHFFSPDTHQLCTNNGYTRDLPFFHCSDTQEELINLLTQ